MPNPNVNQDQTTQEHQDFLREMVQQDLAAGRCIGVRDSFSEWVTPIWLRFHHATPQFAVIRERLDSSGLRLNESGGHRWIPLDVPLGVEGEQMVNALVAQTEEVIRVAYQPL